MDNIILMLPMPPECLHPNARAGWQQRHGARATYRYECGLIAQAQVPDRPRLKAATIGLEFHFGPAAKRGRRRRHDPDNLIAWVKTTIDALVDAGILDEDKDVIYLPPVQVLDAERDELAVTVTEISHEDTGRQG